MDKYTATEQAYKNGYEAGKKYAENEILILKQKRANMFEILDAYERGRASALKWIPVTERLPKPMEWVLCACRANIIEVLRYDHITDDWDTAMPNRCYMKGFATHWMPLPDLPKEEP